MSRGADDNKIPLKPPIIKKKIKPKANKNGVSKYKKPLQIVNIQLKTFIPVGIDISIVQYIKKDCAKNGTPLTNMWCPQTINDAIDIEIIAYIILEYEKIFFLVKTDIIWDIIPKEGKITI